MNRMCFSSSSLGGRRCFSSASAVCGLGGGRTSSGSMSWPAGRSESSGFGSTSLFELGRSQRISYGGGYGLGHCGAYGGAGYGCSTGYGSGAGFGSHLGGAGYGSFVGYGSGGYSSGGYSSGGYRGSCGFGGYSPYHFGSGVRYGVGHAGRGESIQGVCIRSELLKPLSVGVDPEEHKIRAHEKEQIKCLNDQFACFIDKVRCLEQQNKVLATKWDLLQQHAVPARRDLVPLFENYICQLKKQLECLLHDRAQLEDEEKAVQDLVHEFKSKYEGEINTRTHAENEFVVLKKDVDCVFMTKSELEAKLLQLTQHFDFLKCFFLEEQAQLDGQLCDTAIVLEMDNSRDLDLSGIIQSVKCCYEEIAQKSKGEAETFYQTRLEELSTNRGRFCDDLKNIQGEIAELKRLIHKLQGETDKVKKEIACLQTAIADAEQRGDCALKDAREKHIDLQNALQKAKDKLACMVRDYHDLLNVKLALDIEIVTYRKLLEGEESRICTGNPTNVAVVSGGHTIGDCRASFGSVCGPLKGGFNPGMGIFASSDGFSSRSLEGISRMGGGYGARSAVSSSGRGFSSGGISSGGIGYGLGGFSSGSGGYSYRRVLSSEFSSSGGVSGLVGGSSSSASAGGEVGFHSSGGVSSGEVGSSGDVVGSSGSASGVHSSVEHYSSGGVGSSSGGVHSSGGVGSSSGGVYSSSGVGSSSGGVHSSGGVGSSSGGVYSSGGVGSSSGGVHSSGGVGSSSGGVYSSGGVGSSSGGVHSSGGVGSSSGGVYSSGGVGSSSGGVHSSGGVGSSSGGVHSSGGVGSSSGGVCSSGGVGSSSGGVYSSGGVGSSSGGVYSSGGVGSSSGGVYSSGGVGSSSGGVYSSGRVGSSSGGVYSSGGVGSSGLGVYSSGGVGSSSGGVYSSGRVGSSGGRVYSSGGVGSSGSGGAYSSGSRMFTISSSSRRIIR